MKKNIKIYEMPLLHLTMLLLAIGTVMLYSASSTIAINKIDWGAHAFYLNKHLIRIAIGLFVMLIIYNFKLEWLQTYSKNILILSWILILLAYFFNDGSTTRRYLIINGYNIFTTSDFARFAIILFTAGFIDKNKKIINNLGKLFNEYVPYLGITMLLILFQPDFSTTFITSLIIFSMLIIAGLKKKFFNYFIIFSGTISTIILFTYPYAKYRLLSWFYNVNNDPTTQMARATQALYNGGLFGQGFGKSIIKEGFIAESHTDFILPIIGEEFGFIGIVFLFILFFMFYFISIRICKTAPNIFCLMLALGISFNILYYFLINAAYVVGILPPTGLAIPFISYGGSHTLFTLISVGTLLNISKYSNVYKKRYFV